MTATAKKALNSPNNKSGKKAMRAFLEDRGIEGTDQMTHPEMKEEIQALIDEVSSAPKASSASTSSAPVDEEAQELMKILEDDDESISEKETALSQLYTMFGGSSDPNAIQMLKDAKAAMGVVAAPAELAESMARNESTGVTRNIVRTGIDYKVTAHLTSNLNMSYARKDEHMETSTTIFFFAKPATEGVFAYDGITEVVAGEPGQVSKAGYFRMGDWFKPGNAGKYSRASIVKILQEEDGEQTALTAIKAKQFLPYSFHSGMVTGEDKEGRTFESRGFIVAPAALKNFPFVTEEQAMELLDMSEEERSEILTDREGAIKGAFVRSQPMTKEYGNYSAANAIGMELIGYASTITRSSNGETYSLPTLLVTSITGNPND